MALALHNKTAREALTTSKPIFQVSLEWLFVVLKNQAKEQDLAKHNPEACSNSKDNI